MFADTLQTLWSALTSFRLLTSRRRVFFCYASPYTENDPTRGYVEMPGVVLSNFSEFRGALCFLCHDGSA